jgi:hypothetical protein
MARQLERWAPLGGIIFVVLMVVGTMFVADVPDPDAPQQQLANYLADSGNHSRNIRARTSGWWGHSRFFGS